MKLYVVYQIRPLFGLVFGKNVILRSSIDHGDFRSCSIRINPDTVIFSVTYQCGISYCMYYSLMSIGADILKISQTNINSQNWQ